MSEGFLVVGEALTDCSLRGDEVTETPGGSPLNVAIGMGRLGHRVVLATRVGPDSRGQAIIQHAQESGVDLIEGVSGLPRTSTASATIAEDGSASYEFDLLWDITPDMVPNHSFAHLHTGSIGATLEPGGTGVLEIVRQQREAGASISYDPNVRPSIMGEPGLVRDRIEEIIGLSQIVKASDEDIAWLYPGVSLEDVLRSWRGKGASLVVMTKGAEGVTAWAGDQTVSRPTQATSVADTIGAGDSFMSGLLVALYRRELLGGGVDALASLPLAELEACIDFALSCAAVTVSRTGANPPTQKDLDGPG